MSSFNTTSFADIFKELIIDEKGDILPFAHGCSNSLRVGNINSNQPFEEMVNHFLEDKLSLVLELYESTYKEKMTNTEFEIFNWSEIVINKSHLLEQNIGASQKKILL